jgi:hypothetical protein
MWRRGIQLRGEDEAKRIGVMPLVLQTCCVSSKRTRGAMPIQGEHPQQPGDLMAECVDYE